MNNNLKECVTKAKSFGPDAHDIAGKTYGDAKLPYSFHLNMVALFVGYFRRLLKA